MMRDSQTVGIILNPKAGRGRAGNIRNQLITCLQERKIPFQLELTRYPGHAKDLALQMCKSNKLIIAAGGDGTINEVASGIANPGVELAFIPIGSGNDFNKVIGIPRKINQALEIIFSGKKRFMDFGQISYWNYLGEKKKKNFINTLGLGLDAEIADETRKIQWLRGMPLYLLAALKALRKHFPNTYQITEGKNVLNIHAFFICIGNGNYEGGGFKLLPNANQSDSRLDLCILEEMPIYKAIKFVPKLIKGTHENLEKVFMGTFRKLTIESKRPFILHGDGEIFEERALKVKIEIAPKKIAIRTPNEI
jgi:diacylglycerol kinase (ATP)